MKNFIIYKFINMLSIGEKRLRELLYIIYPGEKFIYNFRPDWLKNPKTGKNLEIDIYCVNRKEGWEFQGKQHYKDSYQISKDNFKKNLCKKYGINIKQINLKQLHNMLKKYKNNDKRILSIFNHIDNYIKIAAKKFKDVSAKKTSPKKVKIRKKDKIKKGMGLRKNKFKKNIK